MADLRGVTESGQPLAPQRRLMIYVRHRFQPDFDSSRITRLAGDASSRQYFRYTSLKEERSYVLAVYPEPFQKDSFSYGQMYELLRSIAVPVPEIFDIDGSLGVVLQEDLGTLSLQDHLLTAPALERRERLREAMDHLVRIQTLGTRSLPSHYEAAQLCLDRQKLLWELDFFRTHYLGGYSGLATSLLEELDPEFERIATELSRLQRVLCHRDYHVRNLMLTREKLHVIDFQDARWGPVCYDLASLLMDSLQMEESEVEDSIRYYLQISDTREALPEFRQGFDLMVVQRLLKALGTFGYQIAERDNYLYEQYVTGTVRRAGRALDSVGSFPITRRLLGVGSTN